MNRRLLIAIACLSVGFQPSVGGEPNLPQVGDAGLARAIAEEFGVELLTPLRPNPCHGRPLEPCLAQRSDEQGPFLSLGGLVPSPVPSLTAGGVHVWTIEPSNFCPVPTHEDAREPVAGLEEWRSGPIEAEGGGLLTTMTGLPADMALSSFTVSITNSYIYALSSRGRADLFARARDACHVASTQPSGVVGLASGFVEIVIATEAAAPEGAPPGFDFVPSAASGTIVVRSRGPMFFGVVLTPVEYPVHQRSD